MIVEKANVIYAKLTISRFFFFFCFIDFFCSGRRSKVDDQKSKNRGLKSEDKVREIAKNAKRIEHLNYGIRQYFQLHFNDTYKLGRWCIFINMTEKTDDFETSLHSLV